MDTCINCGNNDFSIFHDKARGGLKIDTLECNYCKLVFSSKVFRTEQKDLDQFYEKEYADNYYEGLKADIKLNFENRLPYQYTRIRRIESILTRPVSLIEIGCGPGYFLHVCKKNKIANVTGIEMNSSERNFVNDELGIRCFKSIEDVQGEKFDIIAMFQLLEHTANPIDFIQNCLSLLKKGGHLVVEVPCLTNPLVSFYNVTSFKDSIFFQEPHLYYFHPETLGQIMRRFTKKENIKISLFQESSFINHYDWAEHNLQSRDRATAITGEYPIDLSSGTDSNNILADLGLLYADFNKKYKKLLNKNGYGDYLLVIAKM